MNRKFNPGSPKCGMANLNNITVNDIFYVGQNNITANDIFHVGKTQKKENMSNETKPAATLDLASLSIEDLQKEMERRQGQKAQDREAYKALVAETVPKALLELANASAYLTKVKTETFKFFEDILELKAQAFDLKEKQRSHTFSSPEGSITIGYRINDAWDDTVSVGIAKVNAFITSLAKDDATSALVETVLQLLKQDNKGNLKGSRVLELQKLAPKFKNADFTDGVDIISKAFKPSQSSWFIEAETKNKETGLKRSLPLNMASADFEADYSFDLFIEKPVKS